jgi:hypothetical protein
MEFAVIVHQLAIIVNHETCIPRHAERVLFHDRETAPDCIFFAGSFECRNFRSVKSAHDLWLGDLWLEMQYSGKTIMSI